MKAKRIVSLSLALLLALVLTVPVTVAEARGSAQIAVTSIGVYSKLTKIIVEASVHGNGIMDKLGTESIYVWRQVDDGWLLVDSLREDDDEEDMYSENTTAHMADYYFDSMAGVAYRVDVTLFAENDEGRDTVSRTFYVTGKSGVSR